MYISMLRMIIREGIGIEAMSYIEDIGPSLHICVVRNRDRTVNSSVTAERTCEKVTRPTSTINVLLIDLHGIMRHALGIFK